jgi:hypothetical protein
LLVVLLIVLSVLFGGFQKGTRENGLGAGLGWRAGPVAVATAAR